MSLPGAGLGSTGWPGRKNALPHGTRCNYQYTGNYNYNYNAPKLLLLVQPGTRETDTSITLQDEPSEALRLTINKTQHSLPQDTLVKRGYITGEHL